MAREPEKLTPELTDVVLKSIQSTVDANIGWFNGLMGMRAALKCAATLGDDCLRKDSIQAAVREFAGYIADEVEELPEIQNAIDCLNFYIRQDFNSADDFLFALSAKASDYCRNSDYYFCYLEEIEEPEILRCAVDIERMGYAGWDSGEYSDNVFEKLKPFILESIAQHPDDYARDSIDQEFIPPWFAEAIAGNKTRQEIEEEKYKLCTPKTSGLSAAQYQAAFREAVLDANVTDVTGLWTYLKTQSAKQATDVPPMGEAMAQLIAYVISRFDNEKSKMVPKLIAATTGLEIHEAMRPMLASGKWKQFKPVTQAQPETETVIDDRYRLLLLVNKESWKECIDGADYHEDKWVPIQNRADGAELMRFTGGEPIVDAASGELIDEEEIRKRYQLYDCPLVECCLCPNWAAGFDYYPLWEAAVEDGSIDEDEIDVDQLSAMIKAGQYWMGRNGGYIN